MVFPVIQVRSGQVRMGYRPSETKATKVCHTDLPSYDRGESLVHHEACRRAQRRSRFTILLLRTGKVA